MEIWPAIDLRSGKCVRLVQGDYQRETVFSEDPAAMARHWAALGADCLHLVDLDGARSGRMENLAAIRAIVATVGVECELGGGIRDEATIRQLLDLGLTRLVIGTLAVGRETGSAKCAGNIPAGWRWGSTPERAASPRKAGSRPAR